MTTTTTPSHPALGVHGGNIIATARALGCRVDELIDMSSNLTPLGPVPGLREALIAGLDQIAYLPETGSEALRNRFAEKHGRSPAEVLVGNGTTEFIFAAPATLGCQRAVIVNPTYGDYRLACQWAGVTATDFLLPAANGFRLDFDTLCPTLEGGELVFICNPNNPTGVMMESERLHRCIGDRPDTLFLVDESYLPFTREPSLLDLPRLDNLLILTSFSKIYGIPGLRLGFLTAAADKLTALLARSKPWGVNRLAQLAGEFLIDRADPYVEEVRSFVASERPRVAGALAALPHVTVVEGRANFLLSRLDGLVRADELRRRMLDHRIMIRNCANFTGLDDSYFRISLKGREANDRCLEALAAVLKKP